MAFSVAQAINYQRQALQLVNSTPSNPSATASTTYVMMGIAALFVPATTGVVLICLCGNIATDTTTDGATVQISYGTGSAPANAAAVTGTQVGAQVTMTGVTNILKVPFSVMAVVTSLTVGTQYWIDAALKAVTGGNAALSNLGLTVVEL